MIHTPGPWCIKHDFNVFGNNGRRLVAGCGGYYSNINSEKIHNENISNAKLISAAPDLFEACKSVMRWAASDFNTAGAGWVEFDNVLNAIKKAEGKEP